MGCPHEVFWDDDPALFWDYVDVFVEEKENELKDATQMVDYQAWLTGAYFVKTLSSFGMLAKNPQPYPSEPFSVSEKTKEKESFSSRLNKKAITPQDEIERQQLELVSALLSYNQRL